MMFRDFFLNGAPNGSNLFPLASIPNDITTGFKKTRNFPLNANFFSEHDFMHAYTTD